MEQFGKNAASVGWGIVSDALLMALDRQKIQISSGNSFRMLVYDRERKEEAVRLAGALRAAGISVQTLKIAAGRKAEEYIRLAERSGAAEVLLLTDGRAELRRILLPEHTETFQEISEYLKKQREGGE